MLFVINEFKLQKRVLSDGIKTILLFIKLHLNEKIRTQKTNKHDKSRVDVQKRQHIKGNEACAAHGK